MAPLHHQPIIIIGAPRSGTNMLRNVLARLPESGTWPCDEINYIWRHGNARFPTDELRPEHAGRRAVSTIRSAFVRLAERQGLSHVLEKTCANSLRVPFVDRVLPEARYLFIVRDGRDATASAMDRWRAPVDVPYLARKARFVPWSDIPHYSSRYFINRLSKLAGRERHLATWGPRFEGMQEILDRHGLAAVCAAQWARCVESSDRAFASIAESRVHTISYEEFVARPEEGLERIGAFLGIDADLTTIRRAVEDVTDRRVGAWRHRLGRADLETAEPWLRPVLARHGYR